VFLHLAQDHSRSLFKTDVGWLFICARCLNRIIDNRLTPRVAYKSADHLNCTCHRCPRRWHASLTGVRLYSRSLFKTDVGDSLFVLAAVQTGSSSKLPSCIYIGRSSELHLSLLCTFTIVGVHLYSRSLFKPKIGHVGHRKSADNPNFTCHHCLQRGVSEVRPNDADGDGKCNSDDQSICMIYNNDPVRTRTHRYSADLQAHQAN
jgi:hypothetical protein